MAANLINTKKTALFIAAGATLPIPVDGFVECIDPTIVVPEFTTIDISRLSGKLNTKDTVIDTCLTKTSFDAKQSMRSSNIAADALDTVPNYGLLLKAAGFKEGIDTATPGEEFVEYTNDNVDTTQVSAIVYMDGNKFECTNSLACGCQIDLPVGGVATITNNFQGYLDSAVPTVEANPDVVLDINPAMVVSCADLITFGGEVIPVENVSIKMNSEIQEIYTTGGATSGIKSTFVSDYALDATLDFFVDQSTFGREAALIESGEIKELVVKIALDSASAEVNGKSVVITMPFSKVTTYSDSTDKDALKRSATYRLFDSGVSPALTIKTGFFS